VVNSGRGLWIIYGCDGLPMAKNRTNTTLNLETETAETVPRQGATTVVLKLALTVMCGINNIHQQKTKFR
jgi:hypothetical protein